VSGTKVVPVVDEGLGNSAYLVGVFTGGSLLAGAVARTDLAGMEQAEPLARALDASLRRLLTLPEQTPVYPTHGAGSFCSAPPAPSAPPPSGGRRPPIRCWPFRMRTRS
jgi:glyoxylase-like metal-dependent hydrolase (beta-lactamase superfamily II)